MEINDERSSNDGLGEIARSEAEGIERKNLPAEYLGAKPGVRWTEEQLQQIRLNGNSSHIPAGDAPDGSRRIYLTGSNSPEPIPEIMAPEYKHRA